MLISSALFCACEKEDLLTPSGADINYFYTLNDTDPAVAALKKEFFEHTNSYLLFNDTLSKIYVGLDRYGTELWKFETVNIQWSMTGYKSGYIEYAPFENFDEQKQAASLIMEKLSSRLGIAPYSYMLSKKMTRWELRSDGTYKLNTYDGAYPTVISGLRCLALAMEDLNEMGEEAFCNYIFNTIILDKLTTLKNSDKSLFNDFFSYR